MNNKEFHTMSLAEIQSENSSSDTTINDGSCSDEGNTDKCTDDKDAKADDTPAMTTSQLRRLRRGRKLRRSGKKRPRKRNIGDNVIQKNETLLLGNLPQFFDVDAVENFLERTTGLTKDICSFYIEVLRHPVRGYAEAVIQFLHEPHLFFAFRSIRAFRSPFTVEIQNQYTPGCRIPQGFLERSQLVFTVMNTIKTHNISTKGAGGENLNNTEENRSTKNTTETSNKPGTNQHAENEQNSSIVHNYVDTMQEESSNNNSTSRNTQNKISNESREDDRREMFSPPPSVSSTKSKQIDTHYGDSDDSTETVVLKHEPLNFDDMATVKPEPNEIDDELPIKQEIIDNSNNLPAVFNVKQKPQDFYENQTQITQNSEIEAAINESANAIDDLLNNIELSEIQIKHESMDTDNDDRTELDLTTNIASAITATNKKQSSSILPVETFNESGEIHELNVPPRYDRDEITCAPTKSDDQAIGNKETCSKKDKSNKDISFDRITEPLDNILFTETAIIDRPTRTNYIIKNIPTRDESDANNCKIVHIKNLPVTSENHLLNIIKNALLGNVDDTNESVLIHILHDEIENKLLGEALLKLKNHKEALRACSVLNGSNVGYKIIDAHLDIGHKIFREHMKFTNSQSLTSRRRRRKSSSPQSVDEPAAKQHKDMESELLNMNFKRQYLPRSDRNADNYGLKPEYLQKLGLKLPLSNTIIVEQLHELVDNDKLYEVFSLAGDVKNIIFINEKRKARIEYDHPIEAVQAIQMFRYQKLFDQYFVIRMGLAGNPRPLPLGLSGINEGFARNGEPLKAVRTSIELRNVHEILFECGKMIKYENNNVNSPFDVWYEKRVNSKQNSGLSASNLSPEIVPPCVSNMPSKTNQNTQSSKDSDIIEALGAVMKARGLIPVETDCKDARNILIALCNDENDPSHTFSNSPTAKNMFIPNAVTNTANLTQSFAQGISTHANVPQNFTYSIQNPKTNPSTTMMNWEQVLNVPVHSTQSSSNYRSDDRKRWNDNSRDPRVAAKGRDSDQNEGSGRVIFKNLPSSINEAVLRNKMSEVGEVLYCEMAGAGSAIVAFKTSQDADRCYRLFNRTKVEGQVIDVICV